MTPEEAFRAGAEAMREAAISRAARERWGREGYNNSFERGAVASSVNIEDAIRALPLPPTPPEMQTAASPRQEDREALLDYIIWQILDVDREDAASMGDQLRAAGFQRVPPGYLVVPGPENREAWRAMADRAERAWFEQRAEADDVLRAALSPYAKEAGNGE